MDWIKPDFLYENGNLYDNLAVQIEDNVVQQVEPVDSLSLASKGKITAISKILTPGLFDVQVNGGGGVMLNNDPTPDGVKTIAQAHRKLGTSFLLPTVITDTHEVIERAAFAVLEQHKRHGVLGIHIEGPHINHAFKGTHDPQHIRPLDENTMGLLATLRTHGLPVLLTLAPELTRPGQIAKLVEMGVVVAAGHTAASAKQTEQALKEGMRGFTHLFNGMPQMTSRAPGVVGVAINSDAWCGIIADGHHVDDRMIMLAHHARPTPNRMVLVSDAMSTAGGPDNFRLYGELIRVDSGKLVNSAGSLAGAHIDLKTSVTRMLDHVGVSAEDSIAMATENPRTFMGLATQPIVGSHLDELCLIYSDSRVLPKNPQK